MDMKRAHHEAKGISEPVEHPRAPLAAGPADRLVSEERISELALTVGLAKWQGTNDRGFTPDSVRDAIRTAVREAGEEAAKLCDPNREFADNPSSDHMDAVLNAYRFCAERIRKRLP